MSASKAAAPEADRALTVIHWGGFSGTVRMMDEPLVRHAAVTRHDITDLTRHPRLLPARVISQVAAIGKNYSWHKTGSWSKAIQREIERLGWVDREVPVVFYQTLAAPILDERLPYVIYTDRVAREGALGHEAFRSTWGPGWVEREEEFLRRARAVLTMGPSTAKALTDLYGLDQSRVHVVGAGPGSNIGPITTDVRAPRRLLFVGTDWRLKGGPEVLDAFSEITGRHPELELVLVGSDPDVPLPPRTQSLGRVPAEEMPGLFSSSDVFVVPTYMEALGYSLLEALMHGLPAIGSTVGNQPWLIDDAGLTVDPGNVAEVVTALEEILEKYEDYKAKSIRRAVLLREQMTWERVASAISDLLLHDNPENEMDVAL